MAEGFLVLNVGRLLDDSRVGAAAADELRKQYEAAKADQDRQRKALDGKTGAELAKAEDAVRASARQATVALEQARAGLREKILTRARPALGALLKERGAQVVLSAAQVLVHSPEIDVTDAIIAAVDADGAS